MDEKPRTTHVKDRWKADLIISAFFRISTAPPKVTEKIMTEFDLESYAQLTNQGIVIDAEGSK